MNVTVKNPKVSVCVVTYNQEKYIRQCLQSIVDQITDFEFEVIVGDDCSTDGTRSIVQEFANKYPNVLKPIFHEKNIGPFKNYIFVHERATGQYIAHMDGDDFWLPEKIEMQVRFLKNNTACSAVYSNAVVVNQFTKTIGVFNKQQPEIFDISYLLQKGNFLNHSSFMYRKKIREKIFDFTGNFIDYRIHLRCSLNGDLGYINKILVGYRRVSTGIASSASGLVNSLYWEAIIDIYIKNKRTLCLGDAICDFMASMICVNLRRGNIKQIFAWEKIIKTQAGFLTDNLMLLASIKSIEKVCSFIIKNVRLKVGVPIVFGAR